MQMKGLTWSLAALSLMTGAGKLEVQEVNFTVSDLRL
jgi:hypothetical protein